MTNLTRVKLLCVTLLWATLVVRGGEPVANTLSPNRAASLDHAIEAEMARQQVVGMAIGVIENDRIVYLKGYGLADRERHVPVTTDTLFRWASCSKPVTATAAMQLVEKGKLDLEAGVRQYVPEFPDKNAPITVRQILSHLGGIVHYNNGRVIKSDVQYVTPHPFQDVVTALDTFKESPLVCRPGEKFSYSTYGFVLASAVVQRAGNQPFWQQVNQRIATPLKMTTFRPDYQWEQIPDRAAGYVKAGGDVRPSSDTDVSWKLGGGGFVSDVGDFARFAQGLLTHRLLSDRTQAAMWTEQKTADGTPTRYALGFGVDPGKDGNLKVFHDGSQEKSRTRLVLYPRQHRGMVLMTNSEWVNPGEFTTLAYRALAAK